MAADGPGAMSVASSGLSCSSVCLQG